MTRTNENSEGLFPDPLVAAQEAVLAADDEVAYGMVGASIGALLVTGRVKPGKRWLYTVQPCDGSVKHLRGYALVRLAREAVRNGKTVVMPREPWRTEVA